MKECTVLHYIWNTPYTQTWVWSESEEQRVGQSYQLVDVKVITRKDSFTFAYLGTVDALRTCPAKHQFPPMPLKLNWLYLFLPSPPPALYTLRCMQIVKTQSPIHNLSAYTFIPMRSQCAPPALPFSLSLFTYSSLSFLSHFVCQ